MTSERRSPRSNGSAGRPLVDVAEFTLRVRPRLGFFFENSAPIAHHRAAIGPRSPAAHDEIRTY
jgi:hypothetical protein